MSTSPEASELAPKVTTQDQGGSESNVWENNMSEHADIDSAKLRHHEPNCAKVEPDVIDSASPLSHDGISHTIDEGFLSATDITPTAANGSQSSFPEDHDVDVEGKASDPIPIVGEEATQTQPPSPAPQSPSSSSASSSTPSQPPSEFEFPFPSPVPGSSPPRLSKPDMSRMVDLSDLTLHSPSSQIVGTPFATNTTRFEYPFPETSGLTQSPPGSGSSSYSHSETTSPSIHPLPPPLIAPGGGVFPTMSMSMSMNVNMTTTTSGGISVSASQLSSPMSFTMLSSPELPPYSPGHHKLKAQAANPPVPPSLRKKRPMWSLSLYGRRRSSGGASSVSAASAGSGRNNLGNPVSEVSAGSIDSLSLGGGGLPGEEGMAGR